MFDKFKLYLAGGLFNAGERLHNLYLERALKKRGRNVILPQREALKFFDGSKFDTKEIADDCKRSAEDAQNIFIGCADGADIDSGTAVEYGVAISENGTAIVYRTDFRTDMEKELGVNAMFHLEGTRFIYHPCYFTELEQVEAYYDELAEKLDLAAQAI